MPFGLYSASIGQISVADKDTVITECEKEVGIGMTLYFRQVKFLGCVFLLLTLISIPSYSVYLSSSASGYTGTSIFKQTSVGHLGESDILCESLQYADAKVLTKSFKLKCSAGEMAALLDFGPSTIKSKCPQRMNEIDKEDRQSLKLLTDSSCNLAHMKSKSQSSILRLVNSEFEKCMNKPECSFSVDRSKMLDAECGKEFEKRFRDRASQAKDVVMAKPEIFLMV